MAAKQEVKPPTRTSIGSTVLEPGGDRGLGRCWQSTGPEIVRQAQSWRTVLQGSNGKTAKKVKECNRRFSEFSPKAVP